MHATRTRERCPRHVYSVWMKVAIGSENQGIKRLRFPSLCFGMEPWEYSHVSCFVQLRALPEPSKALIDLLTAASAFRISHIDTRHQSH